MGLPHGQTRPLEEASRGDAPGAALRAADAALPDDERELFAWAAEVCGGRIVRSGQTSGGNRCRSWALDVEAPDGRRDEVFLRYGPARPPSAEPYTVRREAQVYAAIAGAPVRAPRLLATHPRFDAVLTERARGIAEFRRLGDADAKQAIACDLMESLAALHAMDASGIVLDGGGHGARIADHVRAELAIWRAMYDETERRDPLLDFAFAWLEASMPDPDGAVALVHGDAGPGNFLFENGRLTALIDWELAHLGDPMEDLAWFSMRCVMEPVPDFSRALRDYESFAGRAIERERVRYHRVFVSTRVVVIRHRNVTGEASNTIVSRALNRRLLVEALADAASLPLPRSAPMVAPATERTPLFDAVLDDLRDVVVPRSGDARAVARAKAAAKVLKYLRDVDRYGDVAAQAESEALGAVLGELPQSVEAGQARLSDAIRAGSIPHGEALAFFAGAAAREAQLAADASGGIARRHYPDL